MSGNLVVKTESLPKRCEVCHQSDQFDPTTGLCRRCSPVLEATRKGKIIRESNVAAAVYGASALVCGEFLFVSLNWGGAISDTLYFFLACTGAVLGFVGVVVAYNPLDPVDSKPRDYHSSEATLCWFGVVFNHLFLLLMFTVG